MDQSLQELLRKYNEAMNVTVIISYLYRPQIAAVVKCLGTSD